MKENNNNLFDSFTRQLLVNHEEDVPMRIYDEVRQTIEQSDKERKKTVIYAAASIALLFSCGMGYIAHTIQSINDKHIAQQIALLESSRSENYNNIKNYLTVYPIAQNTYRKPSIEHTYKPDNTAPNFNLIGTTQTLEHKYAETDRAEKHTSTSSKCNTQLGYEAVVAEHIDSSVTNEIASSGQANDSLEALKKRDSLLLVYKYLSLSKISSTENPENSPGNIIASNESSGQRKKEDNIKGWIIGGGFTPMLGENIDNTPVTIDNTSKLKSTETKSDALTTVPESNSNEMSVSFATGISVKKILTNRFNIRTGVTYNKLNVNDKDVSYVELPLMCEYKLLNKRFSIYLSNGVGAGLNDQNTHPVGLSAISFQYPLTKELNVSFEPTYKHIFGKRWLYNTNFYGMTAGVNFMF